MKRKRYLYIVVLRRVYKKYTIPNSILTFTDQILHFKRLFAKTYKHSDLRDSDTNKGHHQQDHKCVATSFLYRFSKMGLLIWLLQSNSWKSVFEEKDNQTGHKWTPIGQVQRNGLHLRKGNSVNTVLASTQNDRPFFQKRHSILGSNQEFTNEFSVSFRKKWQKPYWLYPFLLN